MKIKPDLAVEGAEEDGYDENTIRYYSNVDDDGYFYELYVLLDDMRACIIITNYGVSIDYRESGDILRTNIPPHIMFPDHKELTWDQIEKILKIIQHEPDFFYFEKVTRNENEASYKKWKKMIGYEEDEAL